MGSCVQNLVEYWSLVVIEGDAALVIDPIKMTTCPHLLLAGDRVIEPLIYDPRSWVCIQIGCFLWSENSNELHTSCISGKIRRKNNNLCNEFPIVCKKHK